jgi:hypothetical protein
MPGWSVQERDDEVWAMAAFLRRIPRIDSGERTAFRIGKLALTRAAETWSLHISGDFVELGD